MHVNGKVSHCVGEQRAAEKHYRSDWMTKTSHGSLWIARLASRGRSSLDEAARFSPRVYLMWIGQIQFWVLIGEV